MATHQSAKKRIRSSERKRKRNQIFRSRVKTHIKRARSYMDSGELEAARRETDMAVKVLDKAAVKGILHPRTVARHKSRLMKRLNALEHTASSG